MERLDIKVGDIILVKDPTMGDLSDKLLLVLDIKGTELLFALIDKETNGIEITNDELEEGELRDRGIVMIEKLFTISPIDYQKVASLKKDSLDKILRAFTKYASSIYFKVFHKEKSMDKIPASGKVLDEDDLFNLAGISHLLRWG